MGTPSVQKVYDSYAAFYNFIFGRIFHPGRVTCVELVNKDAKSNAKVLEVGVGTGLSLPLYRRDLKVSGIDISEKMLEKAKERIIEQHLENNIDVQAMDAADLKFADETFDFVVGMYVVSVVPDIKKFLEEISRVVKKNGDIILVNHFVSENAVVRSIEKCFSGAHSVIGFKSDFSIEQILHFPHFELVNSSNTNLFGYWKILHLKKK